jgi:putative nucleotidyltransferase with HDIG domain
MLVAMRAFMKNLPQTEEMQRCWRHCRASALLAEELAGKFGVQKDRAYTAGLMHDLGRFGLLAGSQATYTELLACGHSLPEDLLLAERERLGFDHCEAGALLIKTWRLPSEIARVAAAHHVYSSGDTSLVRAVGAACRLATALGFESVRYGQPADAEEITAALPGRRRDVSELLETLQERFNALALN